MPIQRMGVKLVAEGANRFVNDIYHVTNSFMRFGRSAITVQKALVGSLTGALKTSQAALRANERDVIRLDRQYTKLSNSANRIAESIRRAYTSAGKVPFTGPDPTAFIDKRIREIQRKYTGKGASSLASITKILQQQLLGLQQMGPMPAPGTAAASAMEKQIKSLEKAIQQNQKAIGDYKDEILDLNNAKQKYVDLTNQAYNVNTLMNQALQDNIVLQNDVVDAQKKVNNAMQQYGTVGGVISTILGTLTGQFGKNKVSSLGLEEVIIKLGLKLSAVTVVLDVFKLGLNAVVTVGKFVIGTVKILWDVFSKFLAILGKVGKFILDLGKKVFMWFIGIFKKFIDTVMGGLKEIVSFPFRFVTDAFQQLGDSVKRVFEIIVGMSVSNMITHLAAKIRDLGVMAFDAAANFQLVQIRLRGLIQRELSETEGMSFSDSLAEATQRAKELSYWVSDLAVKTIFNAETINNVLALGMSYDLTEKEAKKLTESIIGFTTGMGLGNDEMVRIVENFGQMLAAGKITGTELRDLSRGAFLPVNKILETMALNLNLSEDALVALRANMKDLNSSAIEALGNLGRFGLFAKEFRENVVSGFSATEWTDVIASFDAALKNKNFSADFLERMVGGDKFAINKFISEMGKNMELTEYQVSRLTESFKTLGAEVVASGKEMTVVDAFIQSFQDMVSKDFGTAVQSAAQSWIVVKSNIEDFIETVLGWRVVTPTLDLLSKRISDFIGKFLSVDARAFAENTGNIIANIVDTFVKVSDVVTPSFMKNLDDTAQKLSKFTGSILKLLQGTSADRYRTLRKTLVDLFDIKDSKNASLITNSILGIIDAFKKLGDSKNIEELRSNIGTFLSKVSELVGILWREYVNPEIEKAWGWIKENANKIWEEKLKPGIEALWDKVLLWFQNDFPAFWSENIAPLIATGIENVQDWVENSQFATNVRNGVVKSLNSITNWFDDSSVGQNIGSGLTANILGWVDTNTQSGGALFDGVAQALTAMFQGAAAIAINAIMGAGGAAGSFVPTKQTTEIDIVSSLSGLSPSQLEPLVKAKDSSIVGAISELNKVTRTALDQSLNEFKTWASDTFPFVTQLSEGIGKVSQTMSDIGFVLAPVLPLFQNFGKTISAVVDTFANLVALGSAGEGKNIKTTAENLRLLVDIGLIPMQAALTGIQMALVPINTFLESLNALQEGVFGWEGWTTTGSGNNIFEQAIDLGGSILKSFQENGPSILENITGLTSDIKNTWSTLYTDLVGNSIVPDMMTDIWKSITEKMTEIVNYTINTFVPQFKDPLENLDMFAIGSNIIQTLYDGLLAMWPTLMAWWKSVISVFSVVATIRVVTTDEKGYSNSTGAGKTGGDRRVGGETDVDAAKGISMVVPSGYPDDNFILGVSSGEGVYVVPKADMIRSKSASVPNQYYGIMGGMGNSYSYQNNKNYNLTVNSRSDTDSIRREFDIIRIMEG